MIATASFAMETPPVTRDPEALIAPVVACSQVIAVVTVAEAAWGPPLARALAAGGVGALEITLRTPAALAAIAAAASTADCLVGAGTCLTVQDLQAAKDAGAAFAVSPGVDTELLEAAVDLALPYLPGTATPSDVMRAERSGYRTLKFFPAAAAGGLSYLAALSGPFPKVRFCPTGGITLETAPAFLAAPNVVCIGGSWLAPEDAMRAGDWGRIERLARAATAAMSA